LYQRVKLTAAITIPTKIKSQFHLFRFMIHKVYKL
jgi:hypothetical protein